jgi:membrane protein
VEAFPSYKTLYGTLSIIPIFLLWVYLVWCIVLFGAEIVAASPEWRRRPGAGTAKGSQPARRLIAALLMLERLFDARAKGKPVRNDTLADLAAEALADSDRGAAQAILDRLADDRIIGRAEPSGWYLARDAKAVKLSALLRDLDLGLDAGEDLAFIRTQWRARLAGVLAGAGAAERAALDMDLETLFAPVAPDEGARPVEPLKRKAAG